MILGSKFKQQRLNLKINQSELCAGICTQAVISKIENQNISPSTDVLIKLCLRLHLTLNDVFSDFSSLPSSNMILDKIQKIDGLLQEKNDSDAIEILQSIDEAKLQNLDKSHVLFQHGLCSLMEHDYEDALFQFNRTIQLQDHKSSFWKFLAFVNLANLYLSTNSQDKAAYYMESATKLQPNVDPSDNYEYFYFIAALVDLSNFYTNTNSPQKVLNLTNIGLKSHNGFLPTKYSDELFYLSALAKLRTTHNKNEMSHDLTMAIAFADFNQNEELLNKLNQLLKDNNIQELKIKP
ncbi:helix-turn-helix domain-containing protein [Companilactobacillus mishanensis]|uniref:DUF3808 domain-containing protein n=1 Tax=Companilactobacillus mishanensis TaxID=2486008 RepID=A0ABW9P4Y8_9LACO|nr:helix-turn-helix transcriptional regulator [Companilactobacillus mishanensis]MQS44308.1 DUF3808 domain-containing protein [Companilactobacillus mishanensis]